MHELHLFNLSLYQSNGAVKEDTVIANGSAVQEGDVETGSLEKGVTAQNTYEEPEAFVTVEAGNRQSNGIIVNGESAQFCFPLYQLAWSGRIKLEHLLCRLTVTNTK